MLKIKSHKRKLKNKTAVVKSHSRSYLKRSKQKSSKGISRNRIAQKLFSDEMANMRNTHCSNIVKENH